MSPGKARANEVVRTSTTNDIGLFRSPVTWTRKAKHGAKICEQWQGSKKRDRVNNLVKWGWGVEQTYKASKLAFSDVKRNRKHGRSPYAGVATGLLKTPWTQLKKMGKMTQHCCLS